MSWEHSRTGGYTLPDLRYTYPRKTPVTPVKHFLRSENVQTAISTLGQYVNGQTSRCASMGKVLFRCEFHISPSSAILLTNELTMLAILSTYPHSDFYYPSLQLSSFLSTYIYLSRFLSVLAIASTELGGLLETTTLLNMKVHLIPSTHLVPPEYFVSFTEAIQNTEFQETISQTGGWGMGATSLKYLLDV